MKQKPSSPLGKLWYFIWYDDSIYSWLVNIILAFLIIKFVVYPLLGLLFGTSFPVVAVVSNSMEHDSSFDLWWSSQANFYQDFDITKEQFLTYPFKNGFNKGDIMILVGTPSSEINIGDVIVYYANNRPYPIIHRVIKIKDVDGQIVFETKGDHNVNQIKTFDLDETNVSSDYYIGRAILRVPLLGYIKIWFANLLSLLGIGNII